MIERIPLAIQTNLAELLDQLQLAQIQSHGRDASFLRRERKGRFYWYVRSPQIKGQRTERYLGPETDALLALIKRANDQQIGVDVRRTIVRALLGAGLPKIDDRTGRVLRGLSEAGVFRLRGALVGTVAFQHYPGLIGVSLPLQALRTGDLDIAQDYGISVALDDEIDIPLFAVLKSVDGDFRAVTKPLDPAKAARFVLPDGFAVDVLTTSRGGADEPSSRLTALRTDATPLRFMNFLIRETIDAATLFDDGVLVRVPAPARYAVHKLIISRKREAANPKRPKDLHQAASLIEALGVIDPFALRDAYAEARDRGAEWRRLLDEAVSLLPEPARAALPA